MRSRPGYHDVVSRLVKELDLEGDGWVSNEKYEEVKGKCDELQRYWDVNGNTVTGVCFPSRMMLLLGFCHRGANVGSLMSDFQVSGLTYPVFENTTIT